MYDIMQRFFYFLFLILDGVLDERIDIFGQGTVDLSRLRCTNKKPLYTIFSFAGWRIDDGCRSDANEANSATNCGRPRQDGQGSRFVSATGALAVSALALSSVARRHSCPAPLSHSYLPTSPSSLSRLDYHFAPPTSAQCPDVSSGPRNTVSCRSHQAIYSAPAHTDILARARLWPVDKEGSA